MVAKFLKPGTEAFADFKLDVALGRVPGFAQDFLIGINPNIQQIDPEANIWDQGGMRTHHTDAPQAVFVSSDDVADNSGAAVLITALDDTFKRTHLIGVLNGQNQVQAFNPLPGGSHLVSWVQAAIIINVGAVGDVYIALTSTLTAGVPDDAAAIQSKIFAGNNITRNGFYMAPRGKAVVTTSIRANTDDTTKIADICTSIKPFEQPALRTVEYFVTPDFPGLDFPFVVGTTQLLGDQIAVQPEKTILEFFATSNSNNTRVFFGLDMLLVDRELIGTGT